MTDSGNEVDLVDRVTRVLKDEVAPVLQLDGGEIEVLGVEGGVVRVRLGGACSGCPSVLQAVIMGVEEELRKRLPEVAYLEAVP